MGSGHLSKILDTQNSLYVILYNQAKPHTLKCTPCTFFSSASRSSPSCISHCT